MAAAEFGITVPDGNSEVHTFIIANQLNPEATNCLLRCSVDVQVKVVQKGPCHPSKVRDQVAVIKKRIQHAPSGVAIGIYAREVESYIAAHNFDEKAKDILRTASNQVQRIVIDRGPCNDCENPSAAILVRAREAARSAVFHDGRPRPPAERENWGQQGGKKRSAAALESESGVPVVTWLSFGATSAFVQAGFDHTGPAILHNKRDDILNKGHLILEQVVRDKRSIELQHDENWKMFPGLGEQFKSLTSEENVFAVATCTEHGKWAAGFHYGWQGREQAAKLALAVAIIAGNNDLEEKISRLFPDFGIILDEAAIGREVAVSQQQQVAASMQASQNPQLAIAAQAAQRQTFGTEL